ncbi:hypothetical protein ACTMU2_21570 [Cupriavidus basilensis]
MAEALPLAQMFVTITLRLNIAALVEGLAHRRGTDPATGYARVRCHMEAVLAGLAAAGEDTAFARQVAARRRAPASQVFADRRVAGGKGADRRDRRQQVLWQRRAPNFLRVSA